MSKRLISLAKSAHRPLIENQSVSRSAAALGARLEAPGRDRRDPPGGGPREVSLPLAQRPVSLFGKGV